MRFIKLHVDIGPNGIVSLEMPGATTLSYAALRFAEHLGLDIDEHRYFLLDAASKKQYNWDDLSADYDGALFVLGCEPLSRTGQTRAFS
jgi:hypothetical protein